MKTLFIHGWLGEGADWREVAGLLGRPTTLVDLPGHGARRDARPRDFDDALAALVAYDWPGNVRELENVVQRAVLLCQDDVLTVDDLLFGPSGGAAAPMVGALSMEDPAFQEAIANEQMADVERVAILATLERTGGNKTEAARRLGLTARTLSNKMKIWRSAGLVA